MPEQLFLLRQWERIHGGFDFSELPHRAKDTTAPSSAARFQGAGTSQRDVPTSNWQWLRAGQEQGRVSILKQHSALCGLPIKRQPSTYSTARRTCPATSGASQRLSLLSERPRRILYCPCL